MKQSETNIDLHEIFHPCSVAVVGASKDERKWGHIILKRLIEKGFPGKIYPINPRADEILGQQAYARIKEVPAPIDTVVIGVNKNHVLDTIKDCADKGVKGAIIVTAGFRETGAEGAILEAEIIKTAQKGGVRIIGPNCAGIACPPANLYLTVNPRIAPGNIAFASQSGNIGNHFVSEAVKRGLGFSNYISVGNQADIDFAEYIHYFGQDPATDAIALYLEGLQEGASFLQAARQVSQKKPIVLLKGGRTQAGTLAVATHTGSLAGKKEIWNAAIRQAGIIGVERFDEFFPVVATFAGLKKYVQGFKAKRIASVTDGGGYGVLTTDLFSEEGLELVELAPDIQQKINGLLPPHAPKDANPVDTAGGMDDNPGLLADCCELLFNEENVDGIMISGLFGGYGGTFSPQMEQIEMDTARRLLEMAHSSGKPLLLQTNYGDSLREIQSLSLLADGGIPIFTSLEKTVRCLKACNNYEGARVSLTNSQEMEISDWDENERKSLLEQAEKPEDLFRLYELPLVPMTLARTSQEAVTIAEQLGYPVVLKIESPDISHKTEAGGILLDLETSQQVAQAFAQIVANAKAAYPQAEITGVTVSPQIQEGIEVIVGLIRDELFGPVIMVGLGGIMVELIEDVSFRVCPVDEDEAALMLKELKMYPLLRGFRGQKTYPLEEISRIISNTSKLGVAKENLEQLDFNPIIVTEKEAWIVDIRTVFS